MGNYVIEYFYIDNLIFEFYIEMFLYYLINLVY